MGLPGTVRLRREGEREARASKDSPKGLPLESLASHALFAASRGTLLCLGFGLCTLFFFLALLAQAGRAVADVRYTSAFTAGNWRFWPVTISGQLDPDEMREHIERVRDQLWAEAAFYEAQGESSTVAYRPSRRAAA